ncbi:RadC family protein [Lacticaseibacillus parakribbianus]|uniref:RadC family protein n=1 Tax=Lacticaseibacillus parakribbianus TaxID=2970927 RepID=UPI0021CB96CF|nr:DNA repair protein RadC [Lacticaseibacillus parakribbianus]
MLPREKIRQYGAAALSDEELVQALLGFGSAAVPLHQTVAAVLAAYPQLRQLRVAEVAELQALPGLGLAKACVLSAAIELGMRVQRRQVLRQGTAVSSATLGAAMVARLAGRSQEVIHAIFLDVQQAVIGEREVARGGLDRAVADPRVVFRAALLLNAAGVVLVHNHPSGRATPSALDDAMTDRFQAAGLAVGVLLVDHLVIGGDNYYSYHLAKKV